MTSNIENICHGKELMIAMSNTNRGLINHNSVTL